MAEAAPHRSRERSVTRAAEVLPVGVSLARDIEYRSGRPLPFRARVRWIDPSTRQRRSKSESFDSEARAKAWIESLVKAARGGVDPLAATMTLAEYGDAALTLALRGLDAKTLDPYMAGWRKRVVPSLGHLPIRMITKRCRGPCRPRVDC
jgi:hypothetical protein